MSAPVQLLQRYAGPTSARIPRKTKTANPLLRGLGKLLGEISPQSIQPDANVSTTQRNIKTLTSYNLLSKKERTIVVPGHPPIWTPKPHKIPPDAGVYIRDSNGHVFAKCPLEPLLRAVKITQPTFKMDDIDLVTDRRNLKYLLGLLTGKRRTFRIDVQVVNSTVLFYTWIQRRTENVRKEDGYGRNFERMSTKNPSYLSGSIVHNRAVNYTLGGLNILLRFEVDACTQPSSDKERQELHHPAPSSQQDTPTGYKVLTMGSLVDPGRIIEIKTTKAGKGKNALPTSHVEQLWFSQTSILCTGQYDKVGFFQQPKERNLEQEGKLAIWEVNHREKIQKLVRMLQMIIEVAKTVPQKRCALVVSGEHLQVYDFIQQDERGVPGDLLGMWEANQTQSKES